MSMEFRKRIEEATLYWKDACNRFSTQRMVEFSNPTGVRGVDGLALAWLSLLAGKRKLRFTQKDCDFAVGPGVGVTMGLLVKMLTSNHQEILRRLALGAPKWRNWFPGKPRGSDSTPLKVLHVTCSFDIGGTQRQIKHLCLHGSDDRVMHQAIETFPEHNFLYRCDEKIEKRRYVQGTLWEKALGYLTLYSSTRSWQVIQVYKFMRDFQESKPDLVIGWGHEIAMLAFIAGALARVPKMAFCIRTFNPRFGWSPLKDLLFEAHRAITPRLDGVITNSTMLQSDHAEWLGIDRDRIQVCPNGIDVDLPSENLRMEMRKSFRNQYGISQDEPLLVHIGRFSREKGHLRLMRSLGLIRKKFPRLGFHVALIGDGPLMQEVKSAAAAADLQKIVFLGKSQATKDLLAAADLFVMPSDFEGMPNAMMEAMAFGLPCVSTLQSGARDVATDGREAFFVSGDDDEGMAAALAKLLSDPVLRREMGSRAAAAIERYAVPRMITRFNKIANQIARCEET